MLQNLLLAFLHFLKTLFLQDTHYPPPLQTTGLTSFQEKGRWVVRAGTESCHISNRSCFSFLSPPSAFLTTVPEAVAPICPLAKAGSFTWTATAAGLSQCCDWVPVKGTLTTLYKYVDAKAKMI